MPELKCSRCGQHVHPAYATTLPPRCEDCYAAAGEPESERPGHVSLRTPAVKRGLRDAFIPPANEIEANPPLQSLERIRVMAMTKALGWKRKPRHLDFFIPESGFLEIGCRRTKQFVTLMTPSPVEFARLCNQVAGHVQ